MVRDAIKNMTELTLGFHVTIVEGSRYNLVSAKMTITHVLISYFFSVGNFSILPSFLPSLSFFLPSFFNLILFLFCFVDIILKR